MTNRSNDNDLKVIHYLLADTDNNIHRINDFVDKHGLRHLIGIREKKLMHDIELAFKEYYEKV